MTGSDIKERAERYIEANTTEDKVLDGIQEALNWLGSMGYIVGVIDVEAESGEFYTLPDDLIRITKIETTNNEGDTIYYPNYLIDGNRIRFMEDGSYKIFAKRNPAIDSISDNIGLHPMLEATVLTYVKGYIKLTIDDTSQDGHKLIEKFERDAAKAYQTLKRNQKSPTKVTVIRHA